jgi:alcohol dehydrogenase class IV
MVRTEAYYNTPHISRFFCPTRTFQGESSRYRVEELIQGRPFLVIADVRMVHNAFVHELTTKDECQQAIWVDCEPSSQSLTHIFEALVSRVECIVAVGGGSTIDTAKAVRARLAFGTWRVKDPEYNGEIGLSSLIALPTTAGSGSETSRYYVVQDSETGKKQSFRSWFLAPTYALIDTYFIEQAPMKLKAASAFDTFTHLWETMHSRTEKSSAGDMLSLSGLVASCAVLPKLAAGVSLTGSDLASLQYASWLGGVALSNVRTGILHICGESLARQMRVPHSLSLMAFFPRLSELHRTAFVDGTKLLIAMLRVKGCCEISDVESLWALWEKVMLRWEFDQELRRRLAAADIKAEAIVADVLSDKVLCEKESPVVLSEQKVRKFVTESLALWK